MNSLRYLCAIAILTLAAACGMDPMTQTLPASDFQMEEDPNSDIVDAAFLRGNLSDMESINDYAELIYSRSNSTYAEVTVYVPHEDGRTAMAIFTTQHGNLGHESLQPGSHHTFSYQNGSRTTELEIRVVGCLIEADSSYVYYDSPARQVEVWVDQLPVGDREQKRINYRATWNGPNSGTFTGYFDVDSN